MIRDLRTAVEIIVYVYDKYWEYFAHKVLSFRIFGRTITALIEILFLALLNLRRTRITKPYQQIQKLLVKSAVYLTRIISSLSQQTSHLGWGSFDAFK